MAVIGETTIFKRLSLLTDPSVGSARKYEK